VKLTHAAKIVTIAAALAALTPVGASAQVAGTAAIPTSQGDLKVIALGYRASKLIRSDVYNEDGKKIGVINDIIITQGRAVSYVIVDVGGFLGIGMKQVAVPASDFKIINEKAVLPGVTAAQLKSLPTFKYSKL